MAPWSGNGVQSRPGGRIGPPPAPRPRYSYELREGVSNQRFGLLLLRQAEVPELIARISA